MRWIIAIVLTIYIQGKIIYLFPGILSNPLYWIGTALTIVGIAGLIAINSFTKQKGGQHHE